MRHGQRDSHLLGKENYQQHQQREKVRVSDLFEELQEQEASLSTPEGGVHRSRTEVPVRNLLQTLQKKVPFVSAHDQQARDENRGEVSAAVNIYQVLF